MNTFIDLIGKFKNKIVNVCKFSRNWRDIEYFDAEWKNRIKALSLLIKPDVKSVMDLGCGKSWLKEFIREDVKYIPVDYVARDDNTVVCDFNNREFPNHITDVIFCSGVLEYIEENNFDWFIKNISARCNTLIISYCALDFISDVRLRKFYGWKNHFKKDELLGLLHQNGFKLDQEVESINHNMLFRLERDRN